jgi:hypothetical protein
MTIWHPTYTITPATAAALMQIKDNQTVVEQTPLSLAVREELRRRARIRSIHYSTRIERNKLTAKRTNKEVR